MLEQMSKHLQEKVSVGALKSSYKDALSIEQGSLNVTHLGGIKQYKSRVIFRDFPYYNA